METIAVTYYDGQSSRNYQAQLQTISQTTWRISYTDKDGMLQHALWEVDKVEGHQSGTDLIRLKYGEYPSQMIECGQETYSLLTTHYPQLKTEDHHFVWLLKKGPKVIIGLTAVFIGLMLLIYFFVLPPLAEFMAGQIPVEYEEQLGESVYQSHLEYMDVNDSLTYWTNDFAKHMDFHTEYPIHITVVNLDMVNAYALPGGEIVVFSGILKEMENKEELAALLAHEVSHVHYRHSLKTISRNLSGYLFMSLLFGDISGVTATIAENSHALSSMQYSRKLEEEADKKGLEILSTNHLSQYGFVHLFERLKKQGDAPEYLQFLSSHPMIDERIHYSKEIAEHQQNLEASNPMLDEDWMNIKRLAHAEEE